METSSKNNNTVSEMFINFFGFNNYKSIFTEEQIRFIRKCREEDNMRNCEIYKLFPNISHTAIDQVLNYKTYKKIPC